MSTASRAQQIRSFLHEHDLRAWIAWRPDELVMMCGYLPFWGASLLLYLADDKPVLFVPQIEPGDYFPAGVRVEQYPWGDLKCADPYAVLVSMVSAELQKVGVPREHVGLHISAARTALPIQAAEQIPMPEHFAEQLSALAARSEARCQSEFLQLYLRKAAAEVVAIRLANRVANVGLQVF